MKVIIQTNKIKCDVGNCRNLAKFSVAPEGVGAGQYINLCEECMKTLYGEIGVLLAPKRKSRKKAIEQRGQNDEV